MATFRDYKELADKILSYTPTAENCYKLQDVMEWENFHTEYKLYEIMRFTLLYIFPARAWRDRLFGVELPEDYTEIKQALEYCTENYCLKG